MKFILIAAALNLQVTYPSETECNKAVEMLKSQEVVAICIPKGETRSEEMFREFLEMIEALQKKETNA
ncbi:MAG: hypothetical protein VW270_08605 [Candidatus Poseidoniales archaeon]|jgi:thiamine pyrophosphate-dependent acetolactate synthase large subunit-like protein